MGPKKEKKKKKIECQSMNFLKFRGQNGIWVIVQDLKIVIILEHMGRA